MTKINGTIIAGRGRASQCIELQKPFLEKHVPEITSMHSGTINIRLERPLAIKKYDIETGPIEWTRGYAERFYFLKAKIEFPNTSIAGSLPCLVYNASTSAYLDNPMVIEVVMQKIDKTGIKDCCIQFEQPCQTLPWIVLG